MRNKLFNVIHKLFIKDYNLIGYVGFAFALQYSVDTKFAIFGY